MTWLETVPERCAPLGAVFRGRWKLAQVQARKAPPLGGPLHFRVEITNLGAEQPEGICPPGRRGVPFCPFPREGRGPKSGKRAAARRQGWPTNVQEQRLGSGWGWGWVGEGEGYLWGCGQSAPEVMQALAKPGPNQGALSLHILPLARGRVKGLPQYSRIIASRCVPLAPRQAERPAREL